MTSSIILVIVVTVLWERRGDSRESCPFPDDGRATPLAGQAALLHQNGMDLARAMDAADQNLLDISGPAWAGDKHHGPSRGEPVRLARK
jgi:hypothetical protein